VDFGKTLDDRRIVPLRLPCTYTDAKTETIKYLSITNVYHYRRPNVYRTCTVDPRRTVDVKFLVLIPNTYRV